VPATLDETSPTADHSSVPKPTALPKKSKSLAIEAPAVGTMVRRWSHVLRVYIEAVLDGWHLRLHIFAESPPAAKFQTARQSVDAPFSAHAFQLLEGISALSKLRPSKCKSQMT
jgi:hypothetical protein